MQFEKHCEKNIVKVRFATLETAFANAAFRQKAVDMGIPFQISTKSVKDEDETGCKKFGFIIFVEHAEDDASDGREKAVQERTVL